MSEETGMISLVVNGQLTRGYDKERLRNTMIKIIKKGFDEDSTFRGGQVVEWAKKVKQKI